MGKNVDPNETRAVFVVNFLNPTVTAHLDVVTRDQVVVTLQTVCSL